MTTNQQLIAHFYTCFQQKDYRGMQACYHPDAVFNDEIFKNLNGVQAGQMWEMLIKSGKDMQLTFSDVEGNPEGGSANWVAVYTFSKTGRKVTNVISAEFQITDEKIIRHTDSFDFKSWARQAFGLTGFLLGGTAFFRNKVAATAMQNLQKFIQTH